MKISERLIGFAAGTLLLTPTAYARDAGTGPVALRGTNCWQFLEAVEMAAAPSKAGDKALPAEEMEAAADAQDELIITLFWVHGYQTGKAGTAAMLDQSWMAGTVSRMVEICGADGNGELAISEAVKQL